MIFNLTSELTGSDELSPLLRVRTNGVASQSVRDNMVQSTSTLSRVCFLKKNGLTPKIPLFADGSLVAGQTRSLSMPGCPVEYKNGR